MGSGSPSVRADARACGRPMGLVGRVLAVDRIFFSRGLCAGFGELERQVLAAGEEERGKLCKRQYPPLFRGIPQPDERVLHTRGRVVIELFPL